MPDISEILARAKPRERTIRICIAGDLAAEFERLETEIQQHAAWKPSSLADQDPRPDLAARVEELQRQMAEAEVPFTFRALGDKAWSDLVAKHPGRTRDEEFDQTTLLPALVAASAIDPVMTREQVDELFEVLNRGQRQDLMQAAWDANGEATAVPFSLLASAIRAANTGEK